MGNLVGNLYITGRDPSFNFEHTVEIAEALNKAGIRTVQGDMIVTDRFVRISPNQLNALHNLYSQQLMQTNVLQQQHVRGKLFKFLQANLISFLPFQAFHLQADFTLT
jgi:hypothetical protein